MQNLRSTSMQRLCLSFRASAARPSTTLLLSSFRQTRSFTSPSRLWKFSASQPFQRAVEDYGEEKPSTQGAVAGSVTPHLSVVRSMTILDSVPEGAETPTNNLLICNIPWTTEEDDLHKIFSKYGPIDSVSIGASSRLSLRMITVC